MRSRIPAAQSGTIFVGIGALTLAVLVAISAAPAGAVVAERSGPSATKRTAAQVEIGAVMQLTGPGAFFGQEYKRGADLALAYINSHGKINGNKLKLKYVDAPTASAAADAVRSLNSQGIKLYIGTGSSSLDAAASSVSDPLRMVGWVTGVAKDLTDIRKYMVQPQVTTDWFVQPAQNILSQLPKRLGKKSSDMTVALVCSNDAYGQSNCAAQKRYIQGNLKAKLVLEQYYDRTATDFSSLIQRLQAARPDAVAGTGYTDDVVLLWRQAKQVGYQPKYFVGSGGAATTNFVDALGSWANGFMTYSYMLPNKGVPQSMAFAAAYLKKYGEPVPSGHALMVYGMMFKLADVLRMTNGNTNADVFLRAAKRLVKPRAYYPDGCGFKLVNNRNSLCATTGMQWQNGKLVVIWPPRVATHKMVGPLPLRG